MADLKKLMTKFPTKTTMDQDDNEIDTDEFEIVLINKVTPDRIVKILKDRAGKKNYR